MSDETTVKVEGAKMTHSATMGELAKALCGAQLEFKPVLKESENPAFRRGNKVSKYADLHSLIKATQPALAKHGLAIIQSASVTNTELTLNTLMVHTSGEWHAHDFSLPAKDERGFTAHSVGKALTYARRYSWQSITGAVAEEDDDGNDASGQGTTEAAQAVGAAKIAELRAKMEPEAGASLFYIYHEKSQRAEITGDRGLMKANEDLLKPLKIGKELVATLEQLEALKFSLADRQVPFAPLRPSNGSLGANQAHKETS